LQCTGTCGDPTGGPQTYLPNSEILGAYTEGQVITLETIITAHHLGHFEFSLCDVSGGGPVTQACLQATPLLRDPTDTFISPPDTRPAYKNRYYLEPPCSKTTTAAAYSNSPLNTTSLYTTANSVSPAMTGQRVRMRYMLPSGVTCAHCVLQWWWISANSCNPPGYSGYNFPNNDGCPSTAWWGAGRSNCGVSYPEEVGTRPSMLCFDLICQGTAVHSPPLASPLPFQFWNCADITIASSGPTGPPVTSAPTPPTEPPVTAAPFTVAPATAAPISPTPPPATASPVTAAPVGSSTAHVDFQVSANWASGCTIAVSATLAIPVSGWAIELTTNTPVTGSIQFWNSQFVSNTNGVITVSNAGWNGQVAANTPITFGATLGHSGACYALASASINGNPATISGVVVVGAPVTSAPVTAAPNTAAPVTAAPVTETPTAPPSTSFGECGASTVLINGVCEATCATRSRRSVVETPETASAFISSLALVSMAALVVVAVVVRQRSTPHAVDAEVPFIQMEEAL
jgi:hypothetical protein